MKLKNVFALGVLGLLTLGVGASAYAIDDAKELRSAHAATLVQANSYTDLDFSKTYVLGWGDIAEPAMFSGTITSKKGMTTTAIEDWKLLTLTPVANSTNNEFNISYKNGNSTKNLGVKTSKTDVNSDKTNFTIVDGSVKGAAGRHFASPSTTDFSYMKHYSTTDKNYIPAHLYPFSGASNVSTITVTLTPATIAEGDTVTKSATVLPADAAQSVNWSINTTGIATQEAGAAEILEDGTILAKKAGKVNVVAKATDTSGVTGSAVLTITANELLEFTVEGTPVSQYANSEFDPTGLTFKEKRSVTGVAELTPDQITFTPNPILKDTTQVTATYDGKSVTITGFEVVNQTTTSVNKTNYDSTTNPNKGTITTPDYVITQEKHNGSTDIKYTYDEMRCYTGHLLTIKAQPGRRINKIVITTTNDKLTAASTITGAEATFNDKVVTLVPTGLDPVTILFDAKAFVTDISVTFAEMQMGEYVRLGVTSMPIKTTYYIGETLDLNGLVVRVYDANDLYKEIPLNELTINPTNGSVLNESNNALKISISYQTLNLAENDCPTIKVLPETRTTFNLLKDVSTLKAGNQVMISNGDLSKVIGNYSTNYNTRDEAKKIDLSNVTVQDQIKLDITGSDVAIFDVIACETADTFAFRDSVTKKYLSASVADKLYDKDVLTDNEYWKVSTVAGDVPSIKLVGNGNTISVGYTYFTTNDLGKKSSELQLFVVDGLDPQKEAEAYSQYFIHETSDDCANGKVLTTTWTNLSDTFNKLSPAAKQLFKEAALLSNTDLAKDDIEKAAQRYDYIVKVYGYDDFANRGIISESAITNLDNDSLTMIITILSISLLAISTIVVFALVRRKDTVNR